MGFNSVETCSGGLLNFPITRGNVPLNREMLSISITLLLSRDTQSGSNAVFKGRVSSLISRNLVMSVTEAAEVAEAVGVFQQFHDKWWVGFPRTNGLESLGKTKKVLENDERKEENKSFLHKFDKLTKRGKQLFLCCLVPVKLDAIKYFYQLSHVWSDFYLTTSR